MENTKEAIIAILNERQHERNKFVEIPPALIEKLEAFISYYGVHGVRGILEYNKEFVIDDLETILAILEIVLEV